MRECETNWGGLTCRVIDDLPAGAAPQLGLVLCHGFGAPGTDLVPLASALMQAEPRLAVAVQFVFPEAPLSLADMGFPAGRAWWHVDLERLQRQLALGQLDQVRNNAPANLPAARLALTDVLAEWSRQSGCPLSRCVLGGFSQGAMLSTDVALHLPESLAGLVIFSGCLMNEQEWSSRAAARKGMPVLQSHGVYDDLLPYVTGTWVRDLLIAGGCDVEFVEFPGSHEIPWPVLTKLAGFLAQRL